VNVGQPVAQAGRHDDIRQQAGSYFPGFVVENVYTVEARAESWCRTACINRGLTVAVIYNHSGWNRGKGCLNDIICEKEIPVFAFPAPAFLQPAAGVFILDVHPGLTQHLQCGTMNHPAFFFAQDTQPQSLIHCDPFIFVLLFRYQKSGPLGTLV
jgi:hypothetical protein